MPKSLGLGSRLDYVLPESSETLGQPAARAAAATAVPAPAEDIVDEVGRSLGACSVRAPYGLFSDDSGNTSLERFRCWARR